MLRRMAGATTHTYMLAVERVPSLRMIEARGSWRPVDHLEVRAVVIRMAFRAGRARRSRPREGRMQALILLNLCGNLPMGFKAFEGGCPGGNLVAVDAVGIAAQALMRARQRAWRNLRLRGESNAQHCERAGQSLIAGIEGYWLSGSM